LTESACKTCFFYQHFIDTNPLAEHTHFIPLTNGRIANIDSADHPELSKYRWSAVKAGRTFYAVRYENRKQIFMHRQITNAPPHLVVDHIDHDGLNNTRENLRLCTRAENGMNQQARINKTSTYKGVYYHKRDKLFYAQISHKGKRYHLGTFKEEKDAAKAYDKKASKLFKNFATLNFPQLPS
jgi:hypothetical protein